MRISHRIRHLERLDAIAHPPTVLERVQRALDAASSGTAGKGSPEAELIAADLQTSLIRKLSDSDLEQLITEIEKTIAGSASSGLPT